MDTSTIAFIIVMSLISIGTSYSRYMEKKEWNNGYCCRCHSQWINFDTDSQGGRGYMCLCKRHIWMSWGFDKKHGRTC